MGAPSGQGESTGPLPATAGTLRPHEALRRRGCLQRLGWGGNTGGSCGLGLTPSFPSTPVLTLLPHCHPSLCLWLRPCAHVLMPVVEDNVSCLLSPVSWVGSPPRPVGLRPHLGPALSPVNGVATRLCTLGSPLGPLVHFGCLSMAVCVSGIPDVGKRGINPAHSLNRRAKSSRHRGLGGLYIRESDCFYEEVCFRFQVVSRIPAVLGLHLRKAKRLVPAVCGRCWDIPSPSCSLSATELLAAGRSCRSWFVLKFYLAWSHGAGWSLVCVCSSPSRRDAER